MPLCCRRRSRKLLASLSPFKALWLSPRRVRTRTASFSERNVILLHSILASLGRSIYLEALFSFSPSSALCDDDSCFWPLVQIPPPLKDLAAVGEFFFLLLLLQWLSLTLLRLKLANRRAASNWDGLFMLGCCLCCLLLVFLAVWTEHEVEGTLTRCSPSVCQLAEDPRSIA